MWLSEKRGWVLSVAKEMRGYKDNIGGCKLLAGSSDANCSSDVNYSSR